jgi:hypothetical protein
MTEIPPAKPTRHHAWRIAKRTLSKSWDVYPLCVGQNPGKIRQRGQSLQDGFTAN